MVEICILAGGLSARMGRDKARIKLGRRTMLALVRETAGKLRLPIRIIRSDLVLRCGPLGGILTGLKTTRAEAVLFLACDMPLVSTRLLKRLIHSSGKGVHAVFAWQQNEFGFPVLLPTSTISVVEKQIEQRSFSLRQLAEVVGARRLSVAIASPELFNVNTPRDRTEAESLLRTRRMTK